MFRHPDAEQRRGQIQGSPAKAACFADEVPPGQFFLPPGGVLFARLAFPTNQGSTRLRPSKGNFEISAKTRNDLSALLWIRARIREAAHEWSSGYHDNHH
jgi:hypothetical protein